MRTIDAELEVARHLERDERLLWAGAPRQGIMFRRSDLWFIPFSLLWGGFAIFWEASVLRAGAPLFFSVWGIPFVLVGLYIMVGRFFVDARQRANTAYAVTDLRILIVSGVLSRSVKSLQLRTLSDVTLNENLDGSGTISFGPSHPMAWWFGNGGWPGAGAYTTPVFEAIPGAKEVYARIREAQTSPRAQR